MPDSISFVANDDLSEWLRAEADRRALTVPALVQQILADRYREDAHTSSAVTLEEPPETTADAAAGDDLAALADEVASQGVQRDALARNPEAWGMEERAGERYYVVELPDGERRFHASRSGAADTVADAYE